jgi:hypothetical protein
MRFFRNLLLAISVASAPTVFVMTPVASAQMTSFTVSSVYSGNSPITGSLCLTATDKYANPISVTKQGGGYYRQGAPFCQTLTSGALAGILSVPDSLTDSAAGHPYSMVIYDSTAHTATQPQLLYGITGSTWSLDNYTPNVTVSTTGAYTYTQQPGAPTGSCTAPAQYSDSTQNNLYVCGLDHAWHLIPGSGGSTFNGVSPNPIVAPGIQTTGPGAGYQAFGQGSLPTTLPSNSIVTAAPPYVPNTFVMVPPSVPPTGPSSYSCSPAGSNPVVVTCAWVLLSGTGSTPAPYTLGALATPTSNWGSEQLAVLQNPFSSAGNISSISIQYDTAPNAGDPLDVCILSGTTSGTSATFTVSSCFTISLAATTSIQTFIAGAGFAPIAVTAGQYFAVLSPSGSGIGKIASGTAWYSINSNYTSPPSGAISYFSTSGLASPVMSVTVQP